MQTVGGPIDQVEGTPKTTTDNAPKPDGTWSQYGYCNVGSSWHYKVSSKTSYWKYIEECSEIWTHQPDPITGETPSASPCICAIGWTDSGEENNPRCVLDRDQEPEECRENGQLFDVDKGYCVLECEPGHPQLNGQCLTGNPEEPECGPDSDNYRGDVPIGYGGSAIPVCGDLSCTTGGKPGQAGVFNNELVCLADDYGAPKCKGESITVIDEYGFVCEPLTNQPEEPENPEAPNTDTDGDGEPDEYQRENDPESIEKGLDNVEKAIREGNAKTDKSNQHLGNIENAVKRIADDVSSLEQMGKNGELSGGGGGASGGGEGLKNDDGEDYLGDLADIKQNTKDTADGIDTLNEKLDDPEGGYSTDELEGRVPTFEESADRLYNTLVSNPTIEAVTTIPELASNNTCPVYTMPSTAYWSAMTIDIHCTILNEHRGTLSTVFLIVWTLTAIMVFLRA